MDNKKDLTKELLADCFRELMLTTSFEKITIKMITDRAGLIRPTFYKHFQDKYEVLEWIFRADVTSSVDLLIENHMEADAIVMFCRCIGKDKKFYRRAYQMDPGPNSFESILSQYIYETFLFLGKRHQVRVDKNCPTLTPQMVAEYYTSSLTHTIRSWILNENAMSAEELAATYRYLMTHSLPDLLSPK